MQFYLSMTQRITLLGERNRTKEFATNLPPLPPYSSLLEQHIIILSVAVEFYSIAMSQNSPLNLPHPPGSFEHNYYRLRKKEGRDGNAFKFLDRALALPYWLEGDNSAASHWRLGWCEWQRERGGEAANDSSGEGGFIKYASVRNTLILRVDSSY